MNITMNRSLLKGLVKGRGAVRGRATHTIMSAAGKSALITGANTGEPGQVVILSGSQQAP